MEGNQLLGSIAWADQETPRENSPHRFSRGPVDICIHKLRVFDYQQQLYAYNSEKRIFCTVLGCVNNLAELRSRYHLPFQDIEQVIIGLYKRGGLSELHMLDGVFLIFLYDENTEKGYLYQPFYGMDLPLYYHRSDEKITFSTNLKHILRCTKERSFNISAAKDMLHNGFIVPSKHTLIRHVYKILAGTYLEIDRRKTKAHVLKLRRNWKPVSLQYAKDHLIDSIHNKLVSLYHSLSVKDFAITHTKGWDSNLMLHFLSNQTTAPIKTVTINGGKSVNEVPFVKEIQKEYSHIVSLIGEVKGGMDQLINLAWIYEGYVFQEGFFLRYELAKTIQKEGIHALIVGACGDQILFPPKGIRKIIRDYPDVRYFLEFLVRRHTSSESVFRKRMSRTYRKLRHFVEIDWLLKMHAIILNHHGIQAIYPYMNRETEWYSRRLGKKNHKKKYYIIQVKKILPEKIVQHIAKSRNVVDSETLFQLDNEVLEKLLSSGFILTILSRKQIRKISDSPEKYVLVILQLLYLYLFNELFVSGSYDSDFQKEKLNISLEDLGL